jgi:hypothetical protein
MMRSHSGRLETSRLIDSFVRILLAAAVMGGICWAGNRYWISGIHNQLLEIVALISVIVVSGLVYLGITYLFKIEEGHDIFVILKRRFLKHPQNA